MQEKEIQALVARQRQFFFSGKTLPLDYRIRALKALKQAIVEKQDKIADALYRDLGKSEAEGFMCETGLVLSEISYMLRHIRRFAREKTVYTPLSQFAAGSRIRPTPYGVTLIMSPWNYPFLLTVEPLVDALAAGNTAVVKPSAYSPATSAVVEELLSAVFLPEYVAVVTGGREENQCLLNEKFDHIFFTGSQAVGREVMRRAADHLTPVTLELGGKSPCIVDATAKIPLAARRIVFGKFLNCGQTCVAPDYILCDARVKKELLACMKAEIQKQFGEDPLRNEKYGKIINAKHFARLIGLIDQEKVFCGGRYEETTLRIAPTILDNVTMDDAVMQEEIFGPVLPVLTFEEIGEVITHVNSHEKPLALYIFSQDKRVIREVTSRCCYGGGCVNDVVVHLATSNMGFGGVGESGMGAYHGKAGFAAFSHHKSILDKKTFMDLPMRYQPYTPFHQKLIRMFLR